uniref:Cyclic nucleotide phosphodiesterase catalytic domain-containing protein n=1 Tax=Periophthalmus magnuspinnatus TaxID=409849 RepID=A0A3B4A520_9GOBI
MDTEQSGEVVEVSASPQQESEIQNEVMSKMESADETETPVAPVTTNGDGEHVNGRSEVEVENGVGKEEAEKVEDNAKMEDGVPQEDPKEEPGSAVSDKEKIVADVGDDRNQPEQEETQVKAEAPVNEAIPEPAISPEPVETQPPKEEEKVIENVEVQKEKVEAEEKKGEAETKKEEDKMAEVAMAAGDKEAKEEVKEKSDTVEFLKTLEVLESFKKHISDFSGKEEAKEVDLEQYFKAKGTLHCTTKFTDYGKAEGAKEYTDKQVVQDLYGSVSDLSLSALFITPRTVGARVSLSEDQLQLWPADAEKEAESEVPGAGALPLGSRAHVTLGCADGVQPVQTGFDLLQIIMLQKDGQQGEQVDIDPGTLTYYGEGRWYLALKEPISATACFSSIYKPPAPGLVKKEKKKPKCTIL